MFAIVKRPCWLWDLRHHVQLEVRKRGKMEELTGPFLSELAPFRQPFHESCTNSTHISMQWKNGFRGRQLTQSHNEHIWNIWILCYFVLLVIVLFANVMYNLEDLLKRKCLVNSHYGQNLFLSGR